MKFPYNFHLYNYNWYRPANYMARDLAENINVYEQWSYMDFPEDGTWWRRVDIHGRITIPAAALRAIGIKPYDKIFILTTLTQCEAYITKVNEMPNSISTVKQKTVDCYNNVKVRIEGTLDTEYMITHRGNIISVQPPYSGLEDLDDDMLGFISDEELDELTRFDLSEL